MSLATAALLARLGPIASGIGALLLLFALIGGNGLSGLSMVGGAVFLGGLIFLYMGRRILRLASPENILTRWNLTADQWRQYVAVAREREELRGALAGHIAIDSETPSGGIEVIALKQGFMVGEHFYEAGTSGARIKAIRVVDGALPLFELDVEISSDETWVRRTMRIPVPRTALEQASKVERHWAVQLDG